VCCLQPGVKGLSENIRIRSIVDRFLEHSRIYYFENACQPQVFLSSADWLPRNFFRRIELAFPIEDGILRERLINEILAISLEDNAKARFLQPDGMYRRGRPGPRKPARRSQFEFISRSAAEVSGAFKSIDGQTKYPRVKLAASPFGRGADGRKLTQTEPP
jgi:polyphosphate kinase